MALTNAQDDGLLALAEALRPSKSPAAQTAYLLVDALRRGSAAEQRELAQELREQTERHRRIAMLAEGLTPSANDSDQLETQGTH